MFTRSPASTGPDRTDRSPAAHTIQDTAPAVAGGMVPAVVLASLLGGLILYGVAFSPVAHEVAHDTRHAIGFPCH